METVLARLPGAKKSGKGWVARCPAHEDKTPSLAVGESDQGKVLLKCHAGCTFEAITGALGMTQGDLFPKAGNTLPPPKRPQDNGQVFSRAKDALIALEKTLGRRSAYWTYHNAQGKPVGLIARWDLPSGKTIRPLCRDQSGKWCIGAMPEPRPLFNLPAILKTLGTIVIVEGEKCALAAESLGLVATTSAGGSQAASKTDWTPLAGREVIILPDNDKAGWKYANDVATIMASLKPSAMVKLVELPGLPTGGDIVEWLEGFGDAAEPETIRGEFLALVEKAPLWVPPLRELPEPKERVPGGMEPDLVNLAEVEPEEVPWLWPGRIPLGRITVLAGRPGCGKSFLTMDIAARLSTGQAWPDGGQAPIGQTLLLSAEDDAGDTLVPRLIAAGADRKMVSLLRAERITKADGNIISVGFSLANIDLIACALDRMPACRLVIVDPIGSYLGGDVDSHRDNEVRQVLAPLAALAAARRLAVMAVCHTRKGMVTHADDAVLGSRGFTGLARCVLHLDKDPNDKGRRLLLPGKSNLGQESPGLAYRIVGEPARLDWETDPLDMNADDLVSGGGRPGPEPDVRNAAVEWLKELLKSKPVAVREVEDQAKEAGFSLATIRRARSLLGIIPYQQNFNGRRIWELPKMLKES